jgi:AraC family transcriptional regulator
MSDAEVRIVNLEKMRVASVLGFGANPELDAWKKLLNWAGEKGLLGDLAKVRFFGFNNPDPSQGSPNYGYEQWITLSSEIDADEGIKVKDFPGGLYAVLSCVGAGNIFPAWQKLVVWCEESIYDFGEGQALEELLNPEIFIQTDGTFKSPESFADALRFELYLSVEGG